LAYNLLILQKNQKSAKTETLAALLGSTPGNVVKSWCWLLPCSVASCSQRILGFLRDSGLQASEGLNNDAKVSKNPSRAYANSRGSPFLKGGRTLNGPHVQRQATKDVYNNEPATESRAPAGATRRARSPAADRAWG
jgi:hypothetical protein